MAHSWSSNFGLYGFSEVEDSQVARFSRKVLQGCNVKCQKEFSRSLVVVNGCSESPGFIFYSLLVWIPGILCCFGTSSLLSKLSEVIAGKCQIFSQLSVAAMVAGDQSPSASFPDIPTCADAGHLLHRGGERERESARERERARERQRERERERERERGGGE